MAEPLKHQKGRKQDGLVLVILMVDIGMVRVSPALLLLQFLQLNNYYKSSRTRRCYVHALYWVICYCMSPS